VKAANAFLAWLRGEGEVLTEAEVRAMVELA
jgi:hypothetical protein